MAVVKAASERRNIKVTYRFITNEDELYHFGVKGMKWGRRRYQNSDGSLTAAGRKRYGSQEVYDAKQNYKQAKKDYNKSFNKAYNKSAAAYSPIKKHREANADRWKDTADKAKNLNKAKSDYKQAKKTYNESAEGQAAKAARRKKALKVGAAVAGTALAAYGAYKVNQYVKTKNAEIAADRGREAARKYFDKEQMRAFNDMKSDSSLITRSVEVNINAKGKEAADRASRDSFGKAAKNVMNYKRSGGDLRNLSDLSNYDEDQWLKVKFGKK